MLAVHLDLCSDAKVFECCGSSGMLSGGSSGNCSVTSVHALCSLEAQPLRQMCDVAAAVLFRALLQAMCLMRPLLVNA